MTHSWPQTRPMPVMMPAPGASLLYMPIAASCAISRNGDPGSSSARTRSRGSILPRAVCRARACSPPPSETCAILSRRSATSAAMAVALAAKSALRGLSLVLIAGMVVLVCCQGLVQRGSSAFFSNHFCTGGGSHALIRSMSVSGSVSASTRGRCSTRTNCCSVARSKKASSGS